MKVTNKNTGEDVTKLMLAQMQGLITRKEFQQRAGIELTYIVKTTGGRFWELTAQEVADLHDSLTTIYNDNYDDITNSINKE